MYKNFLLFINFLLYNFFILIYNFKKKQKIKIFILYYYNWLKLKKYINRKKIFLKKNISFYKKLI